MKRLWTPPIEREPDMTAHFDIAFMTQQEIRSIDNEADKLATARETVQFLKLINIDWYDRPFSILTAAAVLPDSAMSEHYSMKRSVDEHAYRVVGRWSCLTLLNLTPYGGDVELCVCLNGGGFASDSDPGRFTMTDDVTFSLLDQTSHIRY